MTSKDDIKGFVSLKFLRLWMGVSKNSEFDADFESVEKSCKEIFFNKSYESKSIQIIRFSSFSSEHKSYRKLFKL